jgi:hypothetical protein
LSVIGDIFGAEMRTLDATDSAAIGAARLAAAYSRFTTKGK